MGYFGPSGNGTTTARTRGGAGFAVAAPFTIEIVVEFGKIRRRALLPPALGEFERQQLYLATLTVLRRKGVVAVGAALPADVSDGMMAWARQAAGRRVLDGTCNQD
jgi:hypothetical protein